MKLIIEKHVTPSGKPKRRGAMDSAWLEPENERERIRLRKIEEAKYHPIRTHRDKPHSDWDRDIQYLKNVGRTIDPKLEIEVRKIKL